MPKPSFVIFDRLVEKFQQTILDDNETQRFCAPRAREHAGIEPEEDLDLVVANRPDQYTLYFAELTRLQARIVAEVLTKILGPSS